jgi:hypothetical protein
VNQQCVKYVIAARCNTIPSITRGGNGGDYFSFGLQAEHDVAEGRTRGDGSVVV